MNDGMGIVCPKCGEGKGEVTDSRPAPANTIRRRRACVCGFSYTTYEGTWLSPMTRMNMSYRLTGLQKELDGLRSYFRESHDDTPPDR